MSIYAKARFGINVLTLDIILPPQCAPDFAFNSKYSTFTMSSLSTVVSTLVRASMGSSVSDTITDEELDRHVADLILKEAKQKAELYLRDGVRAYLPEAE